MKTAKITLESIEEMTSTELRKAAASLGIKNANTYQKAILLGMCRIALEKAENPVITVINEVAAESKIEVIVLQKEEEIVPEQEFNVDYSEFEGISLINPQMSKAPRANTKSLEIFNFIKANPTMSSYAVAKHFGVGCPNILSIRKRYDLAKVKA